MFVCAAPLWASDDVQFNRDIRPILADNCFQCHGPDPAARKADLRLDREEGYFAEASGPLVVRNKPEASPLYERIMSTDPDMVMPPPTAHKQLKPEQKELIRRWISAGATWQPHWSFLAPVRPAVPEVKDSARLINAIDNFVVTKLTAAGIEPAAAAEPYVLCRRLYLDLTGLPPTPAELADFLKTYSAEQSAESREKAYRTLVDKLLDSPRYGEHRARYWLDAARYADTHGLHFDNYREMWPYRDWVIQAFNSNQPFDRFTVEQLAGDLLPNPTLEQRIATGFHRCNITTNEGGTIADENLAIYARDRVETTSWVWLGLTANCCVCHDHKFDPLTMRDFYSMTAYFRNTTQGSHDGNIKDTKPILYLPQSADLQRYKSVDKELADTKAALAKRRGDAAALIEEWQKKVTPGELDIDTAKLDLYAPLTEGQGNELHANRPNAPQAETDPLEAPTPAIKVNGKLDWKKEGKLGPAVVLADDASVEFDGAGDFERDQPFSVALWVRCDEKLNDGLLVARGSKGQSQGWEFLLQQGGKLSFSLSGEKPKQMIRATTRNSVVKAGVWTHVAVVYDGSVKADGIQLYVNGALVDPSRSSQAIDSTSRVKGALVVGRKANGANHLTGGSIQDLRVYGRRLKIGEIKSLSILHDLRKDATVSVEKRNKSRLATFYLEHRDDAYQAATQHIQDLEDEQKAIQARAHVTHVQEEKVNSPAMANVLMRGEYDKLGDKVTPAVFASLSPLPENAPPNRLGLAQWLIDKQNPLTARVTVNRYWQELFGAGIVKTADDFGIMGDVPSHPELLDWLAVEFRESGWNVKHMFRLMVTSATYRQASTVTPAKLVKDRDNRLLSRGPRFRMDAEMIRDYALATSSTLSGKIGGASVRPYQPEGLWDIVGLPGGNTRDYKQDTGESLYRRSLYTFWKRMSPPPNMETFNAPSREFSCLRRERTNTPLQALVTLNDPQFVEASRNLAQLVLKEVGSEDLPRALDFAATRLLCRPLRESERKVLQPAHASLLAFYQTHPDDAKSLVKVGESPADGSLDVAQLAAWTNLCNTLFNLDEVLNK